MIRIVSLLLAAISQNELHHKYFAVYKPALMLCSFQSDLERSKNKHRPPRPTLLDLPALPATTSDLHVCGRLDRDSEGLLILTNNGAFTAAVLAPEAHCPKTYWALVKGVPSVDALHRLQTSRLTIRGAITQPPKSAVLLQSREANKVLPDPVPGMDRGTSWLEIVVEEGKNRQIRRMTDSIGHKTVRLVRTRVGNYQLPPDLLKPGKWMPIQAEDVLPSFR